MDGTSQRYYQFNTSLDEVLTNIVHGEHCVMYQLAAVPGTNVFLGVVNITCNSLNAFCPCSQVVQILTSYDLPFLYHELIILIILVHSRRWIALV